MTVFRNQAGDIKNIGPWDYMAVEAPRLDEAGVPILDEAGVPILDSVASNPMPDGLVEGEADIVEGPDGGLYEVGDPRLTAAAPVISDDDLAKALAARSGLTPAEAARFVKAMQRPSA
ncbi:hypothetical protein [Methylorubrum thiocyanatum]|uniref:hypothetical protein n=1 Tax=Methylorubrum thiocyanatum TaxID=47958 RepID=UPI0035C84435